MLIKPSLYRWQPRYWLSNLWELEQWGLAFILRGATGMAPRDSCDLDAYVASILSRGLRRLIKDMHGHPAQYSPQEWRDRLTTMAEGFEAAQRIYVGEEQPGDAALLEQALTMLKRDFLNLWD